MALRVGEAGVEDAQQRRRGEPQDPSHRRDAAPGVGVARPQLAQYSLAQRRGFDGVGEGAGTGYQVMENMER